MNCTFELNGNSYSEKELKKIYDSIRLSPATSSNFEKIISSKQLTLNRREKELNQLRADSSKQTNAAAKKQLQLLIKQKEEAIKKLEQQIAGFEDDKSIDYIANTMFPADMELLQQYIVLIRKNPKSFVEIQEAENIIYFYKSIGSIDNNNPIFDREHLIKLSPESINKLTAMAAGVSKFSLDFETLLQERVVNHINGNEDIQQKLKKKFTYDELVKAIPDIDAFTRDFLNISKTGIVSGEQSILAELMFYHMAKTNEEATSEIKQQTQVLDKVTEDAIKELNSLGYSGSKTFDLFFEKVDGKETGRLISQVSNSFTEAKHSGTARFAREIRGLWKTYYNTNDKTLRKQVLQDVTNSQDNIDNWYRNNTVTFDIRVLSDVWDNMSPEDQEFYKDFKGTPDNNHKQEIINLIGQESYDKLIKEQVSKLESYIAAETVSFENMENNPNIQNLEDTKKYYKYRNNPFYGASMLIDNTPLIVDGQAITGIQGQNYLVHVPKDLENFYDENYKTIKSNPTLNAFYTEVSDLLAQLYAVLPPDQKNNLDPMTLPLFKQSFSELLLDKNLSAMTIDMWDGIIDVLTDKENRSTSVDMIDPVTSKRDIRYNYSGLGISERKILVSKREKLLYSKFVADNNREPNSREFDEITAQAQHDVATDSSHDVGKILKLFTAYVTMAKHKEKVIPTLTILQKEFEKIKAAKTTNIFGIRKTNKFGEVETNGERENAQKQVANQIDFFMNRPVNLVELPLLENKTLNASEKKKLNDIQGIIDSMDIPEKYKKMDSAELTKVIVEAEIDLKELTDTSDLKEQKKLIMLLQNAVALREQAEDFGGHTTGSGIGNGMLRYIQWKTLGFNLMAQPANILAGTISSLMAAADGRKLNSDHYMSALKENLFSSLSFLTGGLADTATARKIRNVVDKLDILQTMTDEITKSSVGNISGRFQKLSPWYLQKSSERFIQSPLVIAHLKSINITGKDGKTTSVWNAYDEAGNLTDNFNTPENKQWSDGYGAEVTKAKLFITDLIIETQGDYSNISRMRIKKSILGRMIMQFKNWFPELAYSFLGQERTSLLTGTTSKGRYRSLTKGGAAVYGAVIGTLIAPVGGTLLFGALGAYLAKNKSGKDFGSDLTFHIRQLLRKVLFQKTEYDNEFNELDAANLRALTQQLSILLVFFALYLIVKGMMDDDEDKNSAKNLALNFTINSLLRYSSDLQILSNPLETRKLANNIAPAFKLMDDTAGVLNSAGRLILGQDIIEGGRNDGESRTLNAMKKFIPTIFSLDLVPEYSYDRIMNENIIWKELLEEE